MKLKTNPRRIVKIVPLKINHNGDIENNDDNKLELQTNQFSFLDSANHLILLIVRGYD